MSRHIPIPLLTEETQREELKGKRNVNIMNKAATRNENIFFIYGNLLS